ncbi:TniQ protein [Variovorax sp. NFACC28]|nr:TniQ protein [Variovorax sp. NFACC28]SEG99386.1 TniQ protein [Variovorax sp. NFACC29]SFE24202.1 TniQ protein [Variovorax sp. NFACC26]SFH28336.1 TniQ protein [Variovorax sp. NFACC27]
MNTLLVRTQMAQDCEGNHEALPSWLSRLAHDNGYRSFGSLRTCEQLKVPTRHSLDTLDDDTLASIARLTMSTPAEVATLTLREAMCVFTGSPDGAQGIGAARGRWLLKVPAGVRGPRYAICCTCLASDPLPFFRSHWRFSNVCWCPIHGHCLTDECPVCAKPIALSDSREAKLRFCGTCGHDLASAIAASCEAPSADWLIANPVRITSRDVPVSVAFPHLWWDGIRVLLELACRPREAVRFLKVTSMESSQNALEQIATRPRMDFDKQPAMVRQGLLKMVDELTREWPHRFTDRMGSAGFTSTLFGSTELKIPYWLDTVCAASLYRKRYSTTEGESRAAIALLHRKQESTSKRSVKALLGITESKALDSTVWPIQKALTSAQLSDAIRYLAGEVQMANEARAQQAREGLIKS